AVRRKHEVIVPWVHRQISHRDSGKMVAFKLRPVFPSVDRDPKSKLGSEKEKIGFDRIFLDHGSVSPNAFGVLRAEERRPCLAIIGSFENIRRHVAKGMPIERGVSG